MNFWVSLLVRPTRHLEIGSMQILHEPLSLKGI
jgi:hypothetical protein